MKPPLEADTYGLWFGPLIMLVLGGGIVGIAVFRARTRGRQIG